jgi:hypothetical protein
MLFKGGRSSLAVPKGYERCSSDGMEYYDEDIRGEADSHPSIIFTTRIKDHAINNPGRSITLTSSSGILGSFYQLVKTGIGLGLISIAIVFANLAKRFV